VFCAKNAVDDPQKDQLKILKRVNKELLQRLIQETNLSFGTVQLILKKDLHFFLYRVSVVHEIIPWQKEPPQPTTTSLDNID
jgi:hypothetical protein